ncbi:UvrABC system protein C [Clostridia bacterium]|nr:UvrABC system protein C [Clostridia bacterium]
MFDIKAELARLPDKSGVYLMKNSEGKIIYIGKAKNLKNRVRSYFRESNTDFKVRSMVPNIAEFEYIMTDTELEALILECSLIKKHTPKYNIMLKDSKTYPYIKVTVQEVYPQVFITRRVAKDGARYFGPYLGGTVHELLDTIKRVWRIRLCAKVLGDTPNPKERPCLNYHINKCDAPCMGYAADYSARIDEILLFLGGKYDMVLKSIEEEMLKFAENLQFEFAAKARDNMTAIRYLRERQHIDARNDDNQDVIAFALKEDTALFYVFFVRGGKIVNKEDFLIHQVSGETETAIMTAFIKQFYTETSFIPREIILQTDIDEKELIVSFLKSVKKDTTNQFAVSITVPQKGEKVALLRLAQKNAYNMLEQFGEKKLRDYAKTTGALAEIRDCLNFENPLRRIEAYDISNTQGTNCVGSMVVFEDGKPKNGDYRKFKISYTTPDDYASMEELISRRFKRYLAEDTKFNVLPDMIFMDGGAGQVSSAKKALAALALKIPVCGMVKDDNHRTRGIYYNDTEYSLPRTSAGFHLLTRVQDEVHRFALEYHKKLRSEQMLKSVLDDISGIGEVKRRGLLSHFATLDAVKAATVSELEQVKGISKTNAAEIYKYFHSEV